MRPDSYWERRSAAATEPGLDTNLDVDVCVVGGGYAGLWTALELRRRAPDAEVVVIERDRVAAGASGRNGGLILSYLRELPRFCARLGDDAARELVEQSYRTIDELELWATEHAPAAGFARPGYLWASTSPSQDGAWEPALREAARLGIDVPARRLGAEEAQLLVPSPSIRSGLLCGEGAVVDPAALVRALAAAARAAGVRVHEGTPALEADFDEAVVHTPHARIRAGQVVLATGPWAARHRALRRLVVPVSSHVLVTEPISELDSLWPERTVFTDSLTMVHYAQVTSDGRLALGRGGGAFGAAGRVSARVLDDARTSRELRDDLRSLFPGLASAAVDASWAGAVDRSASGVPFITRLGRSGRTVAVAGFSGKGIVPTILAARAAASSVAGTDDEWARHPFLRTPDRVFPPEPLRSSGALAIRAAVKRKERRELRSGHVDPVTRCVAGLAWSSLPRRTPEIPITTSRHEGVHR